jgi:DNA repair protein RadC
MWMKIRDIPLHLRPRERAWSAGIERLSDAELVAIILRSGKKGKSALDQAHEILSACQGDLAELKSKDILATTKMGIGRVQAIELHAALELGSRLNHAKHEPIFMEDAIVTISSRMKGASNELFFLICLDMRGKCVGAPILVSEGTRFRVHVDAREVLRKALQRGAGKMLVMHNHPSQIASPSPADIILTKQILEASKWVDIELVDHVIVTREELFSMRANGMLD